MITNTTHCMMQAKFMASESEKKYDEISRRLGVVQEVMRLEGF